MESEKERRSTSKVLEEVRYCDEIEHFFGLSFFNKRNHVNIILFACCM